MIYILVLILPLIIIGCVVELTVIFYFYFQSKTILIKNGTYYKLYEKANERIERLFISYYLGTNKDFHIFKTDISLLFPYHVYDEGLVIRFSKSYRLLSKIHKDKFKQLSPIQLKRKLKLEKIKTW